MKRKIIFILIIVTFLLGCNRLEPSSYPSDDLALYQKAQLERDIALCDRLHYMDFKVCSDQIIFMKAMDTHDETMCKQINEGLKLDCIEYVRLKAAADEILLAKAKSDISLCENEKIKLAALGWLCKIEVNSHTAIKEKSPELCKHSFLYNQTIKESPVADLYSDICLANLAIATIDYSYCDLLIDDPTDDSYIDCRIRVAQETKDITACDYELPSGERGINYENSIKKCIKRAVAKRKDDLETCYIHLPVYRAQSFVEYFSKDCIDHFFSKNTQVEVSECSNLKNEKVKELCEWELGKLA